MLNVYAPATKRSSGMLILSGRRLLLLRRARDVRNGGLWGLPGGQRDAGEDAYATASRESHEEVREVPPHLVLSAAAVHRGRKRYNIVACRTGRSARRSWRPNLSPEHDRYRWVKLSWCLDNLGALHPDLRVLLRDRGGKRWLRRLLKTQRPKQLPGGRRSSDAFKRVG
jgi:8-oxo-dGTP pyrophosphatase MutT (NUDIX family)